MSAKKKVETQKILSAAWEVLEEQGLGGLTLPQLSYQTGYTVLELTPLYPSPAYVLAALLDDSHKKAMQTVSFDDGESCKDKLFEAIMAHFDAVEDHRYAIKRLWQDLWFSPNYIWTLKPYYLKVCSDALEASGLDTQGVAGFARVRAFATFCLSLTPTWLNDDTSDQSKTMAAVDKGLSQLEEVAKFLKL